MQSVHDLCAETAPAAKRDARREDALAGWSFAFGEVRHARLRPVHHAFRYRAFFLRVPAHRLDGRPQGSRLFGVNRRALISLHESDHGDGAAVLPWIRGLLREAGIDADGEVWLHAFPRVFGYAFKPVSFWFCHDRDGRRRAIVAEVHNTFGERHCYLLAGEGGEPLPAGAQLSAVKVFHVSPFCDVEGSYRFRFLDNARRAIARIDYDDAQGPLLVTSMSGRLVPVSGASCVRALLGYPLFTFGVIIRIHWQALRLWAKRVRWYSKPEPPTVLTTRGST